MESGPPAYLPKYNIVLHIYRVYTREYPIHAIYVVFFFSSVLLVALSVLLPIYVQNVRLRWRAVCVRNGDAQPRHLAIMGFAFAGRRMFFLFFILYYTYTLLCDRSLASCLCDAGVVVGVGMLLGAVPLCAVFRRELDYARQQQQQKQRGEGHQHIILYIYSIYACMISRRVWRFP